MLNLSVENLLHSNLFNFVIMVIVFAVIAKKIKVKESIEQNRVKIEDTVNQSISTKEQSFVELKNAEQDAEGAQKEIENIIDLAKSTLKTIEEKMANDLKKQVVNIENNVQKVVKSEVSKLNTKLVKGVSNASVALAENHMLKMLDENKDLHNKFINDSIDELDKVEI